MPLLTAIERLDELGDGHLTLSTYAMLQGDRTLAKDHLLKGLQIAVDTEHYATLCHGMATAALLAMTESDVDEAKRRYDVAIGSRSWPTRSGSLMFTTSAWPTKRIFR